MSIPIWDAYDSYTGYVYVTSFSGNLTIINPHTLSIVKNVTIPGARGNLTTITAYGPNVYALSSNGNLSVFNAITGAIIRTIKVENINEISPYFYVKSHEILLANRTGNLEIINTTTYSISYLNLPTEYIPIFVVNYSKDSVFIGGENYSDKIYNLSSKQFENSSMIKEAVYGSSVDPSSGIVYLFGYNESLGLSHIYSVQASTGIVKSVIPEAGLQVNAVFDQKNQNIYADDLYLGSVSVYSTTHGYYAVTFTESGLPAGTSWAVALNGTTETSTTSTITFSEPNGTYTYSIGTVSGYTISSSGSSITVNGVNVSKVITFTSNTTTSKRTSSGISSTELYVIIGAVVAVALIGGVIGVMRKRM
jgi:hypothetical protein